MSYDYTLVKGKAGVSFERFAEGVMSETVGAVQVVKTQISRLFPRVRWEKMPAPLPMSMSAWFGLGGPADFALLIEPDGQVRMITMSNCDRSEVDLVAKELGLVAVDEQSLEQFGIRDGDG
jgi:hypothetical protein